MNEAFLVKIANNNVMPTLRQFQWYQCFGAQVYLVAFEKANDAITSERSILAKISIIKVFPYRGESVNTYILGSRYMWWQETNNNTRAHTHTHEITTVSLAAHVRRGLIT